MTNAPWLLNPGPVTLSERVRAALHHRDLCHRESAFQDVLARVRRSLPALYPGGEAFECVLLTGSGTAGVEAMLATFCPPSARVVVASNGVYGERIAAILATHGREVTHVAHDWLAPLDIARIEAAMAGSRPGALVAVHHETTTGRLTPLAPLADVAARFGSTLLVDAVSSFGAEAIPFEHPGLGAVAVSSTKCLHGIPGIAFVLARPERFEVPAAPPSLYLDLRPYRRDQARASSPYTMAVQSLLALDAAVAELIDEGGVTARRATYQRRATILREGLATLEFRPLVPAAEASSSLTAWEVPASHPFDALYEHYLRAGYVTYAGQGPLAGRTLRLANMGALPDDALRRLIDVTRDFRATV